MNKLPLLLSALLLFIHSCQTNGLEAPDMPEVQFTQLKAYNYTVYADDTTKLYARVLKQCKLIRFEWTATDGYIDGTEEKVIFTAPSIPGTVDISCTVTHPGRVPVTKTISIEVKEKTDRERDHASWIGTPAF